MRIKRLTGLVSNVILCAVICCNSSCRKSKPNPDDIEEAAASQVTHLQPDLTMLVVKSKDLTKQEVLNLEEQLIQEPNNILIRAKLLGFYSSGRFDSAQAKDSYQRHALWIIGNYPDNEIAGHFNIELNPITDGEVYLEAKQLWLKQVNKYPQNTSVIRNAANFFLISESAIAEQLLKKAQSLEPKNPEWPRQLAQLYNLKTIHQEPSAKLDNAKESLRQMEKTLELIVSERERFYLLADTAKAAYKSGYPEKAENYAKELLELAQKYPLDWNYGNAIHYANIILGRIALAQNNVESAKQHLLEAGKTAGSPQLNSFGPNMMLAKELLERNETQTVLSYLELCGNFWEMGQEEITQWSELIKAGKTPDFTMHLEY
jgi:tetratricopeptide (TPR) repeat protein